MVGSAIVRRLRMLGAEQVITASRAELDLTRQADVEDYFAKCRPDEVYLAAARVGGIHANNTYPGQFIYENLVIQSNVIHAAWRNGVRKLLFLGSSCIYPKLATQPITEESLLTGSLEETNEPYAIAKIAGIKLCESYNREYGVDYRSVMPTNLYGPGDNYHPENSHVVPALLRRFHECKLAASPSVTIWGTGTPRREFLHVDDMANASVSVMQADREVYSAIVKPTCSHLNVGFGSDVTIADLAKLVAETTCYEGNIIFDVTRPDGTPRKLMDSTRLGRMGWKPRIGLREGLADAYRDFLERQYDPGKVN